MKKQIREFFDSKGLETHKLVEKNKLNLDRRKIEYGMKRVYKRLADGEEIRDVMLARLVWEEANSVKTKELKDYELELEEKLIVHLNNEIANYRDKFRAMLLLLAVLMVGTTAWLHKIGVF